MSMRDRLAKMAEQAIERDRRKSFEGHGETYVPKDLRELTKKMQHITNVKAGMEAAACDEFHDMETGEDLADDQHVAAIEAQIVDLLRDSLRRSIDNPVNIPSVGREIRRVLHDMIEQGVIPANPDVKFEMKCDEHDISLIHITPQDLYSGLVLQFLCGGLPGCTLPPFRHEVPGSEWPDPSGCVWSLRDGKFSVQPPLFLDFIKVDIKTEPGKEQP